MKALKTEQRQATPEELQQLSWGKETTIIRHEFTADELQDLRNQLYEAEEQQDHHDEILAAVKEKHKGTVMPIKKYRKQVKQLIKLRFEDRETIVELMPSPDGRYMEQYETATGNFVGQRPMRPEERQIAMKLQ